MTHNSYTPAIQHARFYAGDNGETSSSVLGAEDANITLTMGAGNRSYQIRVLMEETGGAGSTTAYACEIDINGAGFGSLAGRTTVVIPATAGLTDDASTSNRATNGLTDGSGSFVSGFQSTDGLLASHNLTANNFTEHVFGVELVDADVNGGDSINHQIAGLTNNVNIAIHIVKATQTDQTLSTTVVATAAIDNKAVTRGGPSATAIGVASLATAKTILNPLSGTAVVAASLAAGLSINQTLSDAAVGVASITQAIIYVQTLAATAVGGASLSSVFVAGAGDAGSANLTKGLTDGLNQPSADALEDYMFDQSRRLGA